MAKEIVPAESNEELSAEDVAFMEQMAAETRKAIDMGDDIRLPSLQMVQATGALAENHKPGSIVHTLTDEEFTNVDVVIANMYKSRVRFGTELGQPPLCNSPNAQDGFGEPGDELRNKGQTGPLGGGDCTRCPEAARGGSCALNYNYVLLLVGADGEPREGWADELPAGVRMKRTSVKTASRINSMMLEARYPWSNVLTLSTNREKNDKGSYSVWTVSKSRQATMPEQVKASKIAHNLMQAQSVSLSGEDRDSEASKANTPDDVPF